MSFTRALLLPSAPLWRSTFHSRSDVFPHAFPTSSSLCASFTSSPVKKEREKRGLECKLDEMVLGMSDVKEGLEHCKHNRFDQGVLSLSRAHDVLSSSLGIYNVNTAYIRERLARAHCSLFEYSKALPLLKETLHEDAFKSFEDDDVLDAYQTAFMCAVAGKELGQAENIAMQTEPYSSSHCKLALGTLALMRGQKAIPHLSSLENDSDLRVRVAAHYTTGLCLWRVCENLSGAVESLKQAAKLAADPEYTGYHIVDKPIDIEEDKQNAQPLDGDDAGDCNPQLEYSGEGGRGRCGIFLEDIWATMGEVLVGMGDEEEGGIMLRDSLRLAETYLNQEAVVRSLLATAKLFIEDEQALTGEGIYRSGTNGLKKFPPYSVRQELQAQLLEQYGELLLAWDKREHEGNTLISSCREVRDTLPDYSFLFPRLFWARHRMDL